MGSNVKVQVLGLNTAINNLEQYIKRKKLALTGVVAESAAEIQSNARQLAPTDLGELKSKITHTIVKQKDAIMGDILSAAGYSAYVEFGSRPHRAPAKALAGWAARHGVPVGAVLNKIAREGTPAQPFMTPAAMKVKPKFIRACRRVMSSP